MTPNQPQPSAGAIEAEISIRLNYHVRPPGGVASDIFPYELARIIDAETRTAEKDQRIRELEGALRVATGSAQYVVDMAHHAADPKNMAPTDWKGMYMHAYASMNWLPAARAVLSKTEGAQ